MTLIARATTSCSSWAIRQAFAADAAGRRRLAHALGCALGRVDQAFVAATEPSPMIHTIANASTCGEEVGLVEVARRGW